MAATGKKKRNTNELLAAAAVGLIAFWAPASDSGLVMRVITAMLALAALFVATVGLEMMEEYKATQAKKANVFDVVVKKVEQTFRIVGIQAQHLATSPLSSFIS